MKYTITVYEHEHKSEVADLLSQYGTVHILQSMPKLTVESEHDLKFLSDPRIKRVSKGSIPVAEDDLVFEGSTLTTDFRVPWGLQRICRRRRSNMDGTYEYARTGSGVNIYVLDGGPLSPGPSPDIAYRLVRGKSLGEGATAHGRNVADIVAGKIYGVAKNATVVDCSMLGTSGVFPEVADWIATYHPMSGRPGVANLSWSQNPNADQEDIDDYNDSLDAMFNAGVVLVAAAGNTQPPKVPAINNNVIAVRAITIDHNVIYPNEGEIYAPTFVPTTHTTSFGGTSAASPHVAGVCALILEQDPTLTPTQVRSILLDWTTDEDAISGGTHKNLLYSLIDVGSGWSNRVEVSDIDSLDYLDEDSYDENTLYRVRVFDEESGIAPDWSLTSPTTSSDIDLELSVLGELSTDFDPIEDPEIWRNIDIDPVGDAQVELSINSPTQNDVRALDPSVNINVGGEFLLPLSVSGAESVFFPQDMMLDSNITIGDTTLGVTVEDPTLIGGEQ